MTPFGPINTGPAVGADGSATSNFTTATSVYGLVEAIAVRYNLTPPNTTDIVVRTAGVTAPQLTLLTLTDANTDVWRFPKVAVHNTSGTALTLDGTQPVVQSPPVGDRIFVSIAGANAGDNADVWLMLADG